MGAGAGAWMTGSGIWMIDQSSEQKGWPSNRAGRSAHLLTRTLSRESTSLNSMARWRVVNTLRSTGSRSRCSSDVIESTRERISSIDRSNPCRPVKNSRPSKRIQARFAPNRKPSICRRTSSRVVLQMLSPSPFSDNHLVTEIGSPTSSSRRVPGVREITSNG